MTYVREKINEGLQHAVAPESRLEALLANCLYDELSNQWTGRGLIHQGGGSGSGGRRTVVVSGAIDTVALARRAILTIERQRARGRGE